MNKKKAKFKTNLEDYIDSAYDERTIYWRQNVELNEEIVKSEILYEEVFGRYYHPIIPNKNRKYG